MKRGTMTTLAGIGMIVGSIPCTYASILIWQLTIAVEEGRAAGRDVGFDVIGVGMMSYFAFLTALASCVAGLLYFGYAVFKTGAVLKAWHCVGIAYAVIQVAIALVYLSGP